MASHPSITVVIPHFGPWPFWTPFFLVSCAANPTIRWLLVGDQLPASVPANVTLQSTSFAAYAERISQSLGIRFAPRDAYKLCDIRPAIGLIHADELAGVDWWGFGDHDVVYGNLRRFLPDSTLKNQWLISSHDTHVAGHLTFLRNLPRMNNAFRQAARWKESFENPAHEAFDEHPFTTRTYGYKRLPAFARKIQRWLDPVKRHSLFVEQYSTILAPRPWWDGADNHPTEWLWKNGRLTNARDGDREFMYFHFMNFKSNRYLPAGHGPAAWQGRLDMVRVSPEQAARDGFRITPTGFEAL